MSRQINLFNPIFLKKKKYFSAVAMAQGVGLILVGSVAVAAYAEFQLSSLKEEATTIAHQLNQSKTQLAKVTAEYAPRQKSEALVEEIRWVEAKLKAQQRVFDMLQQGELGNTHGYAEYMRAFSRQIVDGIWLTGFTIQGTGAEIELRGRALQPQLVPTYLNRLKVEPVMQGKSFATLVMGVPEADPANKDSAASLSHAKERTPAAYIEFTLKSSDAVQEGSVAEARPMISPGSAGAMK